jgi:hypothetical protein|tara:strand:+ start:10482 stop:10721 length:240 start_codon:yes stop_codon:yes gene_type:complete
MTINAITSAIANSLATAALKRRMTRQTQRPSLPGIMGGSSPFTKTPKFAAGPEATLAERTREILTKLRTEQRQPPEETV